MDPTVCYVILPPANTILEGPQGVFSGELILAVRVGGVAFSNVPHEGAGRC